jgi:hypothetical protein
LHLIKEKHAISLTDQFETGGEDGILDSMEEDDNDKPFRENLNGS